MWSDGNDSKRGTRYSNGSYATTTDVDGGHGRLRPRGDGDGRGDATQTESWFKPLSKEEELMLEECPGGVCPVPWAVDTSGEDSSAKSEQSSSWDTYINKHEEVLKEINKDNVNHPAHYTDGGIECIEAIEAQLTPEEYRGYLKGNVAKYVWREQHKGGIESLKKAQWYLVRLINL